MIENNESNRDKLADSVISGMDFDDLIECAKDGLIKFYEENNQKFIEDWEINHDND